ncbi:hypothetical protein O7601_00825 [Verrucosispora sp. WMMD573]|nr:PIN domain-containing protein [Verrucosispora sp. WMMD573]WBB54719.1 hypothetical protein O7601_00825 [Verrucosispora sp. WMMD573]
MTRLRAGSDRGEGEGGGVGAGSGVSRQIQPKTGVQLSGSAARAGRRRSEDTAGRAPSIPDLLIAATAEKTGLTVLAVDKDFDLIATLTGQPIETLTG